MTDFLSMMFLPFMACLILAGMHTFLGLHIIRRQVIFVDLALAQIAVLGASCAILFGHDFHSPFGYILSLVFTFIGAFILSFTRTQRQNVPQEAIIGIVYVVAAALGVIILNFSVEGMQYIKESLVGNILLVNTHQLIKMAVIYGGVGIMYFIFHDKFYFITKNPEKAFQEKLKIRWWDFLFYALFGIIVTSSVEIAGVLVVFSYLVIPASCAILFTNSFNRQLYLGWLIGIVGSVLGIGMSFMFDFPTGASIVCSFGLIILFSGILKKLLNRFLPLNF